jgi:hypothetical protein
MHEPKLHRGFQHFVAWATHPEKRSFSSLPPAAPESQTGRPGCVEVADANGHRCREYIQSGYSCADMEGLYKYDCQCSCQEGNPI